MHPGTELGTLWGPDTPAVYTVIPESSCPGIVLSTGVSGDGAAECSWGEGSSPLSIFAC